MNKKQLPVLLGSFLLFGSFFAMSAAHAEAAGADMPKIAVMDVQEILRSAPQVNAIKEKLKADFASRQTQLAAAQKTLRIDVEKLQADHTKMHKKALDDLQKQIQSEERDIQTKQMSLQKDFFAAQDTALKGLLEQISSKGEEVAKQKQLSLVLVKNSVVYVKDKLDITADVLKLMK